MSKKENISPLDSEIEKLKKAINKTNAIIDYYLEDLEPTDCCPNCKFGKAYSIIEDKLERQEKWLKILIEKKNKKNETQINN